MKNEYWVRPNLLFQADGTQGGDDNIQDPPENKDEELETLDPTTKLFELDLDVVDQLLDREDIDQDKLLDWMKTRNEEATLDNILIKEEKETDKDEKSDDDKGKVGDEKAGDENTDQKEKDDAAAAAIASQTKKDDAASDDKSAKKIVDPGKTDDHKVDDDKTKSKAFKITDDYITKQVQNFKDQWKDDQPEVLNKKIEAIQDILNGIKGNEMDAKTLKNYINAQVYIKTIKSPFDADWKPDQAVVGDPEYIKEATKQKQKMIVDQIKQKYENYPDAAFTDDEQLKEFEDGLSRREFLEYNKLYEVVTGNIEKEYDRYVHVTQNWETIAETTIRTDVALFESRLAKLNLTLKDVGIETLSLNEKDLYNDYLWKNVLFQNGDTTKPNDEVLTFMDDVIPIVKPLSVYHRLMDLNVDRIVAAREHKARVQGFNSGINNVEDPSTSNLSSTEHRSKIEIEAEDFTDDTTPEEDQKKLDQLKSTISMASGAKVGKRK